MEELIFNKWKVGEVIEFPNMKVKHSCGIWELGILANRSFHGRKYKAIKSVTIMNTEYLCFDSNIDFKSYYMIPKSELIRIGMLNEPETKEEMKDIPITFEEAKEIYNSISSHRIKVVLEYKFPELNPKLITEMVKTVEDADEYRFNILKKASVNIETHYVAYEDLKQGVAFARVGRLAHVLNEGWVADYNDHTQDKYHLMYSYISNQFIIYQDNTVNHGIPVFKSRELHQHAIKHNEQVFKDLFKIK